MRRVLGILTEDFRLYHDLVAALKARDLPFTSLSFSRRVPDAVGAILTSPAEASRVHLRNVVPVDDIDSSIAKGLQLLRGKSEWEELRIGVDPGREPGGPARRDSTHARRGARDPAPFAPRQRGRRHNLVGARRGGGPRRSLPGGSDRPRAAQGRAVTGLGCIGPRAPCGV